MNIMEPRHKRSDELTVIKRVVLQKGEELYVKVTTKRLITQDHTGQVVYVTFQLGLSLARLIASGSLSGLK